MLPLQGAQVRSLLRELRSCMPFSAAKKKKKKSLCSIILFIGKARKCKLFHSDSIPNAWDGSRGRERWRDGKELKEPFGRWGQFVVGSLDLRHSTSLLSVQNP